MTMRLLSKKDVRAKELYSPAHIARLEPAGQFPKRVASALEGLAGWTKKWITGRANE